MIIGNGLIAKACSETNHEGSLIFASGVSNSQESRLGEYEREKELFLSITSNQKFEKVIYFSTCSVLDLSLKNSVYVNFKLSIEDSILKSHSNAIILRLPQVIGDSPNKNQLGNFLFDKINSGERFDLYGKSCRHLILSKELGHLVDIVLKKGEVGTIYNVAFSNAMKTVDIVRLFELEMNKTANFNMVDKGSCYSIDNNKFMLIMDINGMSNLTTDPRMIVKKFVQDR